MDCQTTDMTPLTDIHDYLWRGISVKIIDFSDRWIRF